MRLIILKKLISRVLQWGLLVAGILFLLYVLLVSNISLLTPHLQQYSPQITNRLSATFTLPVEVGSFNVKQHELQPVLVLNNVNILTDDSSKVLWHINELHIEVNVWRSILQRRIVNSWIKVVGTTLNVQDNSNGKTGYSINGINLNRFNDETEKSSKQFPKSGNLKIRLVNVTLGFDKWFVQPILIDEFRSKFSWQSSSHELNLHMQGVLLKSAALKLHGDIDLNQKLPNDHLPFVNARIDFSSTQLDKMQNFFPIKIMHEALVQWLKDAFYPTGHIDGTLTLNGDLAHFPFDDNSGIFRINTKLHDLDFSYHKDWPKMQEFNGHLLFNGESMEIVADSAVMAGVPVHNVTATIDSLQKPELLINGQVNTTAVLAQNFVAASPLQETLGQYFTYISLEGPVAVGLHMVVPLYFHSPPLQVNGVVNLQNNTLLLKSLNILLHDIRGAINFTDTKVSSENLNAVLFNKTIALHINTSVDSSDAKKSEITRIVFNNTTSLETLAQHFNMPDFPYLQGDLAYQGVLLLPHDRAKNTSFEINSNLQDIAINYPPILVKPKGIAHDFNARFVFRDGLAAIQIFLHYKDELSAALNFIRRKGAMEFVAGELHFGKGSIDKIATATGLVISGEIDKVNWSEWQQYLWPSMAKTKSKKDEANISALLSVIKKTDLQISELQVFGRTFSSFRVTAVPKKADWLLNLSSPIVNGVLSIPHNLSQETVIVNLQKLYLPDAVTKKDTGFNPKNIPRLHVVINDLRYGNKALGKLEVQTQPAGSGLQVMRLLISAENFILEGTGKWMQVDKGMQSFLQGKCTSRNTGDALKQLHFTESLAKGSGILTFALEWHGAFYDIDTPSLNGNVKINIQKGRIINLGAKTEAEMGIGRLLSILGLQTLPRRLTLDFSDLIKDGFSFDVLQGEFNFLKGDAFTQNMTLSGPAAQVEVKGRIGFAIKDYDINLTVIPHFTSSIPIIAGLAGGPIVGAATWIADKLIGGQVTRVMGYVYKVSGSWVNPNIQKM